MSQITADFAQGGHDHGGGATAPTAAALRTENITLPSGWGRAFTGLAALLGLVCAGLTLVHAFSGTGDEAVKNAKHALYSYHVGYVVMLGLVLGPLGLLMILHLVKAGWTATIRRQLENLASPQMVGLALILAIPFFVGVVSAKVKWADATTMAGDAIQQHKAPFLNPTFFFVRMAIYFGAWMALSWLLSSLSRKQDATGDRWLSNKMSFHSAWGILLFALTSAFAGIDLLKALDFHWFSTMWGVYFFAGNMVSGIALTVVVLGLLRRTGRLQGLVTAEHFHDLGKLMVGFTIFWAYIAFSQYFLYWYANIPEETAYYVLRKANGWENFFYVLMFGHFLVPFVILLFRPVKKSMLLAGVIGMWLIAMHCVDIFWTVRPIVYMGYVPENAGPETVAGKMGLHWVDLTGLLAPLLIYAAFVSRRIASGVLVAAKDPRMGEALEHKNYV